MGSAGGAGAGAGETVLVTGASTGLGLALARLLVREPRYRLVLTARASSLGRFAAAGIYEGERVMLRALDVTVAREREAVVAEINERWGGVEVLVNNAGVAYRAVVEHVREAEAQRSWRSILTGRWTCSAGVAAHAGAAANPAAANPAAAYHAE